MESRRLAIIAMRASVACLGQHREGSEQTQQAQTRDDVRQNVEGRHLRGVLGGVIGVHLRRVDGKPDRHAYRDQTHEQQSNHHDVGAQTQIGAISRGAVIAGAGPCLSVECRDLNPRVEGQRQGTQGGTERADGVEVAGAAEVAGGLAVGAAVLSRYPVDVRDALVAVIAVAHVSGCHAQGGCGCCAEGSAGCYACRYRLRGVCVVLLRKGGGGNLVFHGVSLSGRHSGCVATAS